MREGRVETAVMELAASDGGQAGVVRRGHNHSPPMQDVQQEDPQFEECHPHAPPPMAASREVEQGGMDVPAQEVVDPGVATHVVQAMTSGLSDEELTGLMLSGAGKGALDDALLEQMRIR